MAATVGVVIVAAGSGTRLGADRPKAFVEIGGKSLLRRTLDTVLTLGDDVELVVVVPLKWRDQASEICRAASGSSTRVTLVDGGEERHWSVSNGLAALSAGIGIVLVHDAARAFAPASVFTDVIAEVKRTGDGVVPALPVADTIKRVTDGIAVDTVDRSSLGAMQTPQGFPLGLLVEAYNASPDAQTDDAAVYAAAGRVVRVIDGDPQSFKITTRADLERAESLMGTSVTRTGIGIDIHAFDDSRPLWLGAVHWPDEPGLAGHSDGDALSHAICDALLSAAGLGDLGTRFGSTDPKFAGAHGEVFITETVALVRGAGFGILNVAVQVIGNRPRLAERRAELEKRLGDLVAAPVSVAATTSDGLGFTGTGEGIAAIATALLTS